MTRAHDETDLIGVALDWLKLAGVLAWRNQAGAIFVREKGRSRKIQMGPPGSSDIIGLIPGSGRFFAAEAKVGRRQVTPDQAVFLDRVREDGGLAFVFRSLEELESALREAGYE
jgi:hypothetical protein